MKRKNSIVIIALLFVSFMQVVQAEIRLPAIISSNMVLQRNTSVSIWGWADACEKITIKASWIKKAIEVQAEQNGQWSCRLETNNDKEPQELIIKGRASIIRLDNILFGEVWLCSGQSNMYQPLRGYGGQPTFGSLMAAARSKNPNLRLFTVEKQGSKQPLEDIEKYKSWQEATPESVWEFSAVAYFFGQQLQEILDVPVGLIHTSWGGSKVQAWMSAEAMNEFEVVDLKDADISKRTNRIPTVLYNSMIHPLIPFAIKGALWYQGESNIPEAHTYKELFPAMVKDWRSRWSLGDFPFYYVQIAPYLYGNNEAFQDLDNSAFLREAQLDCLDLIPNSGIAISLDLGAKDFIHPPKKKEVADRLLFNALFNTYGYRNLDCATPVFESQEMRNNGLVLTFSNAQRGLYAPGELNGFEIAGEDRIFYPATAKIERGRYVYVKSEKVVEPVAVRYAWRNWVEGSLYDVNLLPVSSFRTDRWDDASHSDK
jgi:sialate O-acetylesterase